MGSLKTLRWIALPFKIAITFMMNLIVTISPLVLGFMDDIIFKKSTDIWEVKESNKKIAFLKANNRDYKYFWQRQYQVARSMLREVTVLAEENEKAPNTKVIRMSDRSECRLLDFAKAGRPMVVNFGSCTCPPFMANLERFREDTEDFAEVADFVLVYVAEAHPTDGWHIEGNIRVANHRNIQERFDAAKRMLDLEPQNCPVLIDPFTDETNLAYAGLPERLYIILDGVVVYKGGRGPFGYKLREIEEWLKKFKGE